MMKRRWLGTAACLLLWSCIGCVADDFLDLLGEQSEVLGSSLGESLTEAGQELGSGWEQFGAQMSDFLGDETIFATVIKGIGAGMSGGVRMASNVVGALAESWGKVQGSLLRDPEKIGSGLGDRIVESIVERGKGYMHAGEKFWKRLKVGDVLGAPEEFMYEVIEGEARAIGKLVSGITGVEEVGEEFGERLAAGTHLAAGIAGIVLMATPLAGFGGGEYDPSGYVISELISSVTGQTIERDEIGCTIDPALPKVQADLGDGAKEYALDQLLCHIERKMTRRVEPAELRNLESAGRYLTMTARPGKEVIFVLEAATGDDLKPVALYPMPYPEGGAIVGATTLMYDPKDGSTMVIDRNGEELGGEIGRLRGLYCLVKDGNILRGDPSCSSVTQSSLPLGVLPAASQTVDCALLADPRAAQLCVDMGSGVRSISMPQLLCEAEKGMQHRFYPGFWQDKARAGVLYVLESTAPEGTIFIVEDGEGVYRMLPDPTLGMTARGIAFDPSTGDVMVVQRDGQEYQGNVGAIGGIFCLTKEGDHLKADPMCSKVKQTYETPEGEQVSTQAAPESDEVSFQPGSSFQPGGAP